MCVTDGVTVPTKQRRQVADKVEKLLMMDKSEAALVLALVSRKSMMCEGVILYKENP